MDQKKGISDELSTHAHTHTHYHIFMLMKPGSIAIKRGGLPKDKGLDG